MGKNQGVRAIKSGGADRVRHTGEPRGKACGRRAIVQRCPGWPRGDGQCGQRAVPLQAFAGGPMSAATW